MCIGTIGVFRLHKLHKLHKVFPKSSTSCAVKASGFEPRTDDSPATGHGVLWLELGTSLTILGKIDTSASTS